MLVPIAWSIIRKRFTPQADIVFLDDRYPFGRDTISFKSKENQSVGIEPYAMAMSSHMFARLDLLDRASFNADHTIDICSQHPGTFFMQPF